MFQPVFLHETRSDWEKIPVILKRAIQQFRKTIDKKIQEIEQNGFNAQEESDVSSESYSQFSNTKSPNEEKNDTTKKENNYSTFNVKQVKNSPASQGNLIEAISLTLDAFDHHHVDRDLRHTGQNIIIISAGSGIFDVTPNNVTLHRATKHRMMDNGINCDLVCLGRPPLHAVPVLRILHQDQPPSFRFPYWLDISFFDTDSYRPVPSNSKSSFSKLSTSAASAASIGTNSTNTSKTGSASTSSSPSSSTNSSPSPQPSPPAQISTESAASSPSFKPVCRMPEARDMLGRRTHQTLPVMASTSPVNDMAQHDRNIFNNPKPSNKLSIPSISKKNSSNNNNYNTIKKRGRSSSVQSFESSSSLPPPSSSRQTSSSRPLSSSGTTASNPAHAVSPSTVTNTSSHQSYMHSHSSFSSKRTPFRWQDDPSVVANAMEERQSPEIPLPVSVNRRRWRHLFPSAAAAGTLNWSSLCEPACLPMTTDYWPPGVDMETKGMNASGKLEYNEYGYSVMEAEARYSMKALLRELISQRLHQGYQIVDWQSAMEGSSSPNIVRLTMGHQCHRLVIDPSQDDTILVRRFTRRSSMAQTPPTPSPGTSPISAISSNLTPQTLQYTFHLWNPLLSKFEKRQTQFRPVLDAGVNWNSMDQVVCGFFDSIPTSLPVRRVRFCLLPQVNTSQSSSSSSSSSTFSNTNLSSNANSPPTPSSPSSSSGSPLFSGPKHLAFTKFKDSLGAPTRSSSSSGNTNTMNTNNSNNNNNTNSINTSSSGNNSNTSNLSSSMTSGKLQLVDSEKIEVHVVEDAGPVLPAVQWPPALKRAKMEVPAITETDRYQWLHFFHAHKYHPRSAFMMELHWLVCSGKTVDEFIQSATRKAKQCGFTLVQTPSLTDPSFSNPFRTNVIIPLSQSLLPAAAERLVHPPLNFLPEHLDACKTYIHVSGGAIVTLTTEGIRWLYNIYSSEPIEKLMPVLTELKEMCANLN